MKQTGLWLWAFCFCLAAVHSNAQVQVEVRMAQDQFLPGESLPVEVRVNNTSGQLLQMGSEEDWLTFSIKALESGVVSKLAEVPVVGAFDLPSSKIAKKKVDLAPYFGLTRAGLYSVTAQVHLKDWDKDILSVPRKFNVIEGTHLWEQEVGLPGSGKDGGAPEVRKYLLQQALYLKGETRLYLRITDGTGAKTIRTILIGHLPGLSRPESLVDQQSNMHLIYQSGPQDFHYLVFNPDGTILKRQRFDYVGTRPRLEIVDGVVREKGGVRHEMPNDLPEPNPVSKAADSQP
jgi:hypothetical protein